MYYFKGKQRNDIYYKLDYIELTVRLKFTCFNSGLTRLRYPNNGLKEIFLASFTALL